MKEFRIDEELLKQNEKELLGPKKYWFQVGLKEFRCPKCGKLLGKIYGKAEIKCPRCQETNTVDTVVNKNINRSHEIIAIKMLLDARIITKEDILSVINTI